MANDMHERPFMHSARDVQTRCRMHDTGSERHRGPGDWSIRQPLTDQTWIIPCAAGVPRPCTRFSADLQSLKWLPEHRMEYLHWASCEAALDPVRFGLQIILVGAEGFGGVADPPQ